MKIPQLPSDLEGQWILVWRPYLDELIAAADAVAPGDFVSQNTGAEALDRLAVAVKTIKGIV